MKRRDLLLATGALGALAATHAKAQTRTPRVIGWLGAFSKEGQKETLEHYGAQLARLGQVEGRDFIIEGRWTDGKVELLAGYAREIVALKPAVIITNGAAAIGALKVATTTVPIVFLSSGDPVAAGFVATLARPGGNITGVMLRAELLGKLFELMREILPAARRVALLEHVGDPATGRVSGNIRRAAAALSYELVSIPMARVEDADRTLAALLKAKADAMIVPPMSLFLIHAQAIGALAAKARVPIFATWRIFADNGGLLSYYSDFREAVARGAVLTDKILRGAAPADLPIEQPDRYTLVVNMQTAKALGVAIPQSVLLRADEVIQ